MNFITLFRCDLTTKAVVVAPPSYENPRDASDHPEAMAMDPNLRNYVCELFFGARVLVGIIMITFMI